MRTFAAVALYMVLVLIPPMPMSLGTSSNAEWPGNKKICAHIRASGLGHRCFPWSVDDELGGWAAVDDAAAPEDDKLGA
jgi:hypothetical protein